MKSLINGSIYAFSKKPIKKASIENIEDNKNNSKENKNLKILFDTNPKKFDFKSLKSSVVGNKGNYNNINDLNRSKTNPIKKNMFLENLKINQNQLIIVN